MLVSCYMLRFIPKRRPLKEGIIMKKVFFKTSLGITLSVLASVLFLAHKSEFFKDDSALYDEFDSTLD